jgi:hypothetical protein
MKKHQPISLSVYEAVKAESKQRRTPMYSALAHEIDSRVVDDILKSKSYKEYQFLVQPKQYGFKLENLR